MRGLAASFALILDLHHLHPCPIEDQRQLAALEPQGVGAEEVAAPALQRLHGRQVVAGDLLQVLVRRGPMATCFAIHRTLFEQGYPFAYDLRELADYWIGYERLMAHWRQRLPGRFTEIAYEDLVVDAETTLRAAMPTIGVDFDPACLHFHENPAPSSTASASQVRRPLYRESLDLWGHYRHLLKPAADRLRQAGIVFES